VGGCLIEAPWLVNGGHSASLRQPFGSPIEAPPRTAASSGLSLARERAMVTYLLRVVIKRTSSPQTQGILSQVRLPAGVPMMTRRWLPVVELLPRLRVHLRAAGRARGGQLARRRRRRGRGAPHGGVAVGLLPRRILG
jgi:hypothetical protein